MEVHNVGDVGSFVAGLATSIQDGADDFLLVDDHDDCALMNTLQVFDGLTGSHLWNLFPPVNDPFVASAAVGWDVAGGKNCVGDSYPDIVVGAHRYEGKPGGFHFGAILIYDGHQPTSPPMVIQGQKLPGVRDSLWFGLSVDFAGELSPQLGGFADGYSELLVADAGYKDITGEVRAVHLLDVNQGQPNLSFIVLSYPAPVDDFPGCTGSGCPRGVAFGWDLSLIGDPYDSSDPTGTLGHDDIAEFAASDPFWVDPLSTPNLGSWCLMTVDPGSFNPLVRLPSSVNAIFRGTVGDGFHAKYLSAVADPNDDAGSTNPNPSYRTYGTAVATINSARLTIPRIIANNFYNYGLTTGGLHTHFDGAWDRESLHCSSLAGIGDINLDGFDDFAVVANQNTLDVYSGEDTSPLALSLLFSMSSYQGNPLGPVPADPDPPGCNSFGATNHFSVNRLGDIDRDGVSDFGIVAGADTSGDGNSDVTLVVVFGSNVTSPGGVVAPQPGVPYLSGNVVSQVETRTATRFNGTKLVVSISNGTAGASVDLYEGPLLPSTQYLYPCPSVNPLRVNDPSPITLTYNADGVANYIDYRDASSTTIGSKVYFQAIHSLPSPGSSCAVSATWELAFVDSSNPYQWVQDQ